ncbi:hypothetical protein [Cylindrospermum stagnale]|uniref:hypothetical protein n=1 Tax=Cylindrospermum stagnale TaxID=142864 RepID=UPI0002F3FFA9|nr:hypothetical protein [Cylindrospermum stagnale]
MRLDGTNPNHSAIASLLIYLDPQHGTNAFCTLIFSQMMAPFPTLSGGKFKVSPLQGQIQCHLMSG